MRVVHEIYSPMRAEVGARRAAVEILLAPYSHNDGDAIHIEGDLDCILNACQQVVTALERRKKEAA